MRGGFVGGEVNSGAVLVFKSHAIPQKVSHVMVSSNSSTPWLFLIIKGSIRLGCQVIIMKTRSMCHEQQLCVQFWNTQQV